MNKATIVEDAITYIQELQKNVKDLSDQLLEMEASSEEEAMQGTKTIDAAAEDMNTCGIQVTLLLLQTINLFNIQLSFHN